MRADAELVFVRDTTPMAPRRAMAPGTAFVLEPDRRVVLGRAPDADIVFFSPAVARHHLALTLHTGEGRVQVELEDLGGTNGNTINGEPFRGKRWMAVGDALCVAGAYVFALR